MSPERDDPTDDQDLYEDVPPRSIFAATWFRVVLVLIVLGVFGAVAVPYVLDWMNPAPVSRSVSAKATSPVPQPAPIAPLPASESAPSSSASSTSSAEKSSSVEKKDPALASPPALAPPPSLAKPEPKPAPVAKPPASKMEAKSTGSADTSAKTAMAATESNGKSAAKTESSAKSEAAKAPAAAKTESTPKSQVVAKAEPPKDATKTAATTPSAAKAAAPANAKVTGTFWVQVGAFRDAETAKRVATALRDQNYKVEESNTPVNAKAASAASPSAAAPSPAASPGDLYDVYVTGMSAVELTKRLSAKGLAAEASGGSVVVKPSLPLRDAVGLSKDLAVDGLKVQVRRAGSGASGPVAATPPAPATAGETLHRVRVGAFTDVAEARAAFKELEGKGYKPFIARGDQ